MQRCLRGKRASRAFEITGKDDGSWFMVWFCCRCCCFPKKQGRSARSQRHHGSQTMIYFKLVPFTEFPVLDTSATLTYPRLSEGGYCPGSAAAGRSSEPRPLQACGSELAFYYSQTAGDSRALPLRGSTGAGSMEAPPPSLPTARGERPSPVCASNAKSLVVQ